MQFFYEMNFIIQYIQSCENNFYNSKICVSYLYIFGYIVIVLLQE